MYFVICKLYFLSLTYMYNIIIICAHVAEIVAGFLLVIKIFFNSLSLIHYVWTFIFGGPVDLTDRQRRLLGVQENG